MPFAANDRVLVEDVTEKCSVYLKETFPGQLEISFPENQYFKFVHDIVEKNFKLLISKYDFDQKKPFSVNSSDWNSSKKLTGKRYKILSEKTEREV